MLPPPKPDEWAEAHDAIARSYQKAAALRVRLGWILLVLLVVQVLATDALIVLVAQGYWKLDAAQLAAVIGGTVSEVAAITVLFVKWLYTDPSPRSASRDP